LQSAFPTNITTAKNYLITPVEKYAELLNNSVRLSISKNNAAMMSDPNSNSGSIVYDNLPAPEITQLTFDGVHNPSDASKSIYSTKRNPKAKPKNIVGLFLGGQNVLYGVYHPTGHCAMLNNDLKKFSHFCPICKYVLVNKLNPTMHRYIERDYNKRNNPKI
jgi:hypothetical protein